MAHVKKEDPFYGLLGEFSTDLVKAANDYVRFVDGYPDTITMIPTMKLYESRCDAHVRTIMKELYTSFITPFDRDDISSLALRMDDIMDYMARVCTELDLFNMSTTRREARELAGLTQHAIIEFNEMVEHLADYKKDPLVRSKALAVGEIEDQGDDLFNMSTTRREARELAGLTQHAIIEFNEMVEHLADYKKDPLVRSKALAVGEIEDQGDDVYDQAIYRLYHDDSLDEARRGHVVGWMRVFDRMEDALDACDAAAGVVRTVIMKSA